MRASSAEYLRITSALASCPIQGLGLWFFRKKKQFFWGESYWVMLQKFWDSEETPSPHVGKIFQIISEGAFNLLDLPDSHGGQ